MELVVQEVLTKSHLKEYIFLPRKLYASYPNWVPPMYADEWNFHDPTQNSALDYSTVIRLIAYRNKEAVGRIMGIINRKYNQQHKETTARFFNFDVTDDEEVANALIGHIEVWARSQGTNKLIGPYGFSDKDPQGMQIEGFENLPVIATPSHPPYLQKLVEPLGFTKSLDCISYRLPITPTLPPLFSRIFDRIKRHGDLKLVEFKSKRQLKPFIVPVFRLVNETYAPLFGFVPMTEQEMQRFAAQYLPVLDPTFVKVVVNKNKEIVSFVVAMPDISPGIQKARGKLFPFGFIHILRSMKRSKQLNLMLGAVLERYRGKGVTVLLANALFAAARSRGMTSMDSHLVLETNRAMRAECENVGGTVYKRYRVYQKQL